MAQRAKKQSRLGRPPAKTSAETRGRIITAARECFARYGFDKTTNQVIARQAGITSGAIYHYFESKQELFEAVAAETQTVVLGRFLATQSAGQSVIERINAVLDSASELNSEDPSMAAFVSTAPIEVRRHEQFDHLRVRDGSDTLNFFAEIVREGKERGEITADVDEGAVAHMLLATTAGIALYAGFIESPEAHLATMAAFKRLVAGTLMLHGEPAPSRRAP